jgi:hypothetical protein
MKGLLKLAWCATALVVAQNALAQAQQVTPTVLTVKSVNIRGTRTLAPVDFFYDNTMDTGFYFPPPSGAVPVEVADDIPFKGTHHVSTLVFAYATDQMGDQEVLVNFYGALMPDTGPAQPPVASLDLTGLPGSPDGTLVVNEVTFDLLGAGMDFDWTASVNDSGYSFNWLGFTFQQNGAGLLTATGGGSMDVFWTNKDLNSPYGGGSFFWFFSGHNPEASFHIKVGG